MPATAFYHPRQAMLNRRALRLVLCALCLVLISAGCATAPPPPPPVPEITWEQKLDWIIRLEDQRILRDPNPPPPTIVAPATRNRPAIVAPLPPSDLVGL